ncbi:ATP-binding protein [Hymenobacter weizhouensis]|uniref:ATP-binding protein n=1 Tax=Hymenobacter sp. YIM 151500-1 TaxID=2987689 RepID=UPI00222730AE|nr:ATP-binding protein [Hymenobacter sp. YIM 151500-1]UYZ61861.1 tetratricopeptide repeat protein [Hymenobacter sp. YIM 151500-1]
MLLFLLLCRSGVAWAAPEQSERALLRQLSTPLPDTGRVRVLNQLCEALHDRAPTRALRHGEQAVNLARRVRDQRGLLLALLNLASCYANLSDGPHALELQRQALLLARRLSHPDGLVRSYTGMGGVHHERNDTAAALLHYRRALELAYQPGVQVRTQLVLFGNLGNLYFSLQRQPEGLVFTRRALALARRTGDVAGESQYLAELGSFYQQLNQLETAEGLLRQAVALVEPLENFRFEAGHRELLAAVLLQRQELPEAEALTQQALGLARRINYQERVLDAYELLAEINARRGQYEEAFAWQRRFQALNDSINSRSRLQTLAALQTRYETAEKESQIRLLTERGQVAQQRNRALLGTVAALLLGLGVAGLLYAQLRRNRADLAANNRALQEATHELRQLAASKDRLYAIVAHDLRGPVTSFAGVTELIDFYLQRGDEQGLRRLPALVRQSAHQLNHLLDNLLSWAVSQTGELAFQPERLPVGALFDEVTALYASAAEAKQLTLHAATTAPDLAVWADPHMTRTILRNLVGNALKATPAGGTIQLSAALTATSTGVQLHVTDTGPGMLPEQVAALLSTDGPTSLSYAPRSGTGLGLPLCRAFARRQGGSLSISSTPGHGTTVSVTLPASQGNDGPLVIVR